MCNPQQKCARRLFTVLAILSIVRIQGFAADSLDPAVKNLVQKAFTQKTEESVRKFFEKNMTELPNTQARIHALTLLAAYEQQCGNYAYAASWYVQAARLESTEGKNTFLLDAVQALLCGGEYDRASSLLATIAEGLPVDAENAYYRRYAVYNTWRMLAEGMTDKALTLIKKYATQHAFAAYHPALLFTLWWVSGDSSIKEELCKKYPTSIEAAAVNGTVTVHPSTFWYLMPKGASLEKDTADVTVSQKQDDTAHRKAAKPSYYQLGFYRTKKYAQALVDDLQKSRFNPIIKEEIRPSGTLYFAVLVQENESGTMGILLKNAGYEAFPVFP